MALERSISSSASNSNVTPRSENAVHGLGGGNDLDDEDEGTIALLRPLLQKAPSGLESRQGQGQGRDNNNVVNTNCPHLDSSKAWSSNLRDLHILSSAFLFVFLAYCAIQNLESSINTENGLGSAALGILYLSLTICSLGAPLVVLKLGSKNSLLLGLTGYWAFIAANIFPTWITLVPAAIFLGFTASVLWVAEGTYLTFAAKEHAASCAITEAGALGNFNGEFWSVFSLNQVVGNLVTLVLLQTGTGTGDGDGNGEADTHTSNSSASLFVAFLGSMAVGSILMFLLRSHPNGNILPRRTRDGADVRALVVPQRGLVSASFALLSDKKMLLLIFLLFYTGMQQAFIWGDFTKDIITSSFGLSWVGGVMAAYGACDALGSLVAGRYSSGLRSITIILCGGAVCQILVIVQLLFKDRYSTERVVDVAIIFAMAVIWGVGDATFNTQISAVLAIFYPRDIEAAFAQWKIWQSAGTSVIFFASPYANFSSKLLVLLPYLVGAMGLFFFAMTGNLGFQELS